MKTEELDIIRDAVHNALEAVRCLGGLEKKSSMILISKNDLKTYLGGNLEGKLVEAYKILEIPGMEGGIYIRKQAPVLLDFTGFQSD